MFIYFQQEKLSFEELRQLSLEEINKYKDLYLRQTLLFCSEWLNGKETFTVQTSGSTGTPKPIHLARHQMLISAQMTAKALGLSQGDKALVCLNTAYIAGKMMLVRGLEIGMQLLIVSPIANPFSSFVSHQSGFLFGEEFFQSIDFYAFVPLQLLEICKAQSFFQIQLLNQSKAVIVGGAPVSAELEYLVQQITSPIYATYGMTETVSHIALKRLNGRDKSPYYQLLANTEIGQDERGCLTIISPVNNFEKIVTNDKVKIIDNQRFEWLGRIDAVINSGGIKIQIEKVENEIDKIFLQLQVSRRFIILGFPEPRLGERVILVLEGEKLEQEVEKQLFDLIKNRLSKYEIPKEILYMPYFPETATAKMDRLKIKEKLVKEKHLSS
jgi:O-succinylbenzoic acid--CoA ligase